MRFSRLELQKNIPDTLTVAWKVGVSILLYSDPLASCEGVLRGRSWDRQDWLQGTFPGWELWSAFATCARVEASRWPYPIRWKQVGVQPGSQQVGSNNVSHWPVLTRHQGWARSSLEAGLLPNFSPSRERSLLVYFFVVYCASLSAFCLCFLYKSANVGEISS